ncbi:AAA family ATPase [Butyrivibrio sp.]|uniref:AAA family ATPase n=1 Tax=Butyrivibrio sp. TaxID=28121 RepID=UPI0025B9548E|nr:AAA family ATPase [Butyrivibrio sp.]MBQ9306205.1 AAA family ATPase [Butyrivibrio sp.]
MERFENNEPEVNEMLVYSGEGLRTHINSVLEGIKNERDLVQELHSYIEAKNDRKVCCLYGLRRTGKTTIMLQEIQKINDCDKCLLIECGKDTTVMQLRKTIEAYPEAKYVFVDEITKAVNFIDTASVFSNKYAAEGKKVVLTGTDSLGFYFAKSDELFDRAHFIHTTFIPFKEYHSLLGKGILDYIRYGGTLSPENVFYNRDASNEYSNSAIVFNIIHSLEKWNQGRNFGVLEDLVESGDLPTFINKVIEYDSRLFLAKIINKEFCSHDLGSLLDLMTKSGVADPDIIYPQGASGAELRKEMQERIRFFLNIKNSTLLADEYNVNAIIQYLKELDVLYELSRIDSKIPEYIFTQPGMRYSQATDLARALVTSEVFSEGYSVSEQEAILEKLEQDICGGILEDIILYQTIKSLEQSNDKFLVSKYQQLATGKEFDVFIANFTKKQACIIEVKLSDKADAHQVRHLTDKDICKAFESKIGTKIVSKAVVYNGENRFNPFKANVPSDRVVYLNAKDYLIHCSRLAKELTASAITDRKQYRKAMKNAGIKLPNQEGGIGFTD